MFSYKIIPLSMRNEYYAKTLQQNTFKYACYYFFIYILCTIIIFSYIYYVLTYILCTMA